MVADESHDDRTQSFVALTVGTKVSHYKIIEKIGAGGMGEVYLAADTKLNRRVALKFLPSHFCQDDDCRAQFKREAQAVAKLNHPNIITIYEVTEVQGISCAGSVEYYQDGNVTSCTLGREDTLSGQPLPMGTVVHLTPDGYMDWCFLKQNIEIQGHLCSGNGHDFTRTAS